MLLTVLGRWGGCCRAGGCCSGYLLGDGTTNVLLDCGSGVAGALQRAVPLESVDDVVLSHWHADHTGDAGVLLHGRLIQTLVGEASRPLRFHAPAQEPDLGRLTWEPYAYSDSIDGSSTLAVGGMELTFCRTAHPVECYAVRAAEGGRAVGYTADGALTPELARFMAGVDLLVAECSLYGGTDGAAPGHMNALDVAELARLVQPRTLLLTHLPLYGDVEELLGTVRDGWSGDVRLAREGRQYEV